MTNDNPNIVASSTRFIIKDFQADEHFSQRPYVKGWPFMRKISEEGKFGFLTNTLAGSYAEVPIISPLGYVIGGYCVVDNKLRDFDDFTIKVLSEIGSAIMSHLEHVRLKNYHARSEKLLQGLDQFIQEEHHSKRKSKTGRSKGKPRPELVFDDLVYADDQSKTGIVLPSHAASPLLSPTKSNADLPNLNEGDNDSVSTVKEPLLNEETQHAFVRSSSLIRESLNMDGLMFLDASPLSFGSNRYKYLDLEHPAALPKEEEMSTDLESSVTCPILASSMVHGELPSGDGTDCLPFSEQLLHRIIRRFPRGQLFTADEHGFIETSLGHGPFNPDAADAGSGAQEDIDELFSLLPQARSIVFLPLWHFQKERWFAAAVGWTRDPSHSFDPTHSLTYLSAFGNSIMAEVLRYEALAVSKAKSDFISRFSKYTLLNSVMIFHSHSDAGSEFTWALSDLRKHNLDSY